MISQKQRDSLRKRINPKSDYKKAAELYEAKTGRYIHHRYLYKLLTGERKVEGTKPGSHQPLQMWEAMVDAIQYREMKDEEMTGKAREMLERLAA